MKDVRVGVIGLGWGQLQIGALGHVENARVTALCDTNQALAQSAAKESNIARTYADYHDLLSDPEIDLVSVAAPPELHKPIVCAAIEAGKHVFCEKPLALNAHDARALLDSAEKRKIVHAVDMQMRYLPAVAYAKELIDEDYLGPLLRVDVTMAMERPWGEHGNWAADGQRGGGMLMEVGTHFGDALRFMFGEVKEVFAEVSTHFTSVRIREAGSATKQEPVTLAVTADDSFWCAMNFERGGQALLSFVSGARHDPGWSISAYGRQGALVIKSGYLSGARVGDKDMAVLGIPKRLELLDHPRDPLMWSMAQVFQRVVSKIRGERDSLAFPTFRDGVAVAQVIDAIRRSSEAKTWVTAC